MAKTKPQLNFCETRPQFDKTRAASEAAVRHGVSESGMATTTATGAGMSSTGTGKASRKHSPGKKQGTGFLANSKREMRIDYLGEATPGPGSYLPASTFGKHDKSLSKMSKVQSSAFRSGSSQRPKSRPSEVPGPGAHSPNHLATSSEKKKVRAHRTVRPYRTRRLTRSCPRVRSRPFIGIARAVHMLLRRLRF
jgi:hypothetical protein